MTFQYNISIGDIVVIVTFLVTILRYDRKMAKYFMEHEMMMEWYCDAKKIKLSQLITRRKGTL